MAKRLWGGGRCRMIVMMCGLSSRPKNAKDVKTAPAPAPVPAKASEPIKIGAIFAVTGPAANLGAPEEKTARMLVDEINGERRHQGEKLLLIIKDSQGSPRRRFLLPNSGLTMTSARRAGDEERLACVAQRLYLHGLAAGGWADDGILFLLHHCLAKETAFSGSPASPL